MIKVLSILKGLLLLGVVLGVVLTIGVPLALLIFVFCVAALTPGSD